MTDPNNETQPRPLWEFVPATAYTLPPSPVAYRVKGGIAGLIDKLKPAKEIPESPLQEELLQALPDRFRDYIAQAPDWQPAALALDQKLNKWGQGGEQERMTVAVVSPPHVANGAILKHFSNIRSWRVIPPPTAEQIANADTSWLKAFTHMPSPWVLPNLEKCYLRHYRGLALVRQLFVLLHGGRAPQGIIGCDSWAWAYFQRVMPELLPTPITLQAFDPMRLVRWLRDLAPGFHGKQVRFRQSDNGNDVLPPPSTIKADSENATTASQFVKNLAAFSRGIPGVAWSIWGSALRSLPEDTDSSCKDPVDTSDDQTTIWLPPWEQLEVPIRSSNLDKLELLVLHNILLHAGLSLEKLQQVSSFTATECSLALSALKNAGYLEYQSNVWQVTAAAYPTARQMIKSQGYLTDAF